MLYAAPHADLPSGFIVASLPGLRRVLGYPDCAFPTRGRGGRSATARDVGGHARPFEPSLRCVMRISSDHSDPQLRALGLTRSVQGYGSGADRPKHPGFHVQGWCSPRLLWPSVAASYRELASVLTRTPAGAVV